MENGTPKIGRTKYGAPNITGVDVRQAPSAELCYDGAKFIDKIYTDSDVAGATELLMVIIGDFTADISFSIDFKFNDGKIGSTVTVTATNSSDGVATITAITGVSDNQFSLMTSAVITMTSPINTVSTGKAYLVKKAVLG